MAPVQAKVVRDQFPRRRSEPRPSTNRTRIHEWGVLHASLLAGLRTPSHRPHTRAMMGGFVYSCPIRGRLDHQTTPQEPRALASDNLCLHPMAHRFASRIRTVLSSELFLFRKPAKHHALQRHPRQRDDSSIDASPHESDVDAAMILMRCVERCYAPNSVSPTLNSTWFLGVSPW